MTAQEIENRRRMFHWFVDGIGMHGIPWSLYGSLTPEWVSEHYNVNLIG